MAKLLVFGLNGSKPYAGKVARLLDTKLSSNTEQFFDDSECYLKSDVNVRNADAYVIAGLYTDDSRTINEKLVNLLWFVGSLHDASARRITAVLPYMGYARQDRKTESRAPITTKYMAQVLQAVGVDRVLTIDVHSLAAFQNSFSVPVDNLDTVRLFTDYLCGGEVDGIPVEEHIPDPLINHPDDIVALSPDIGGITRTSILQMALKRRLGVEVPLAVFDKRRVESDKKKEATRSTELLGDRIIGDVKGKRVIIYDDLIGTGNTIVKACDAVERDGGTVYAVCAAHGLFTNDSKGVSAEEKLAKVPRIIITDTVPPWRLNLATWGERLKIVPTTLLVAQAIKRTHEEGGSISDLLKV